MKIKTGGVLAAQRSGQGFTLIEILVATVIISVVFGTLYTGIASGFRSVGLGRENLRATQILLEKTEMLRLYTWEQLTNSPFPNFTVNYYPSGSGGSNGVLYSGSFKVATAKDSGVADSHLKDANYDDSLRVVTITLNWTSGTLSRSRSLSTIVTANGIHNYVY